MVRSLSVPEEELDIRMEDSLIAFDRKEVVSAPTDQICSLLPLGEQRIGGNVLPPDVDTVDERDEDSYLIGALERVPVVEASDFFWV